MHFDIEIEINASPDRVWAVLVDVERWPEWMASYTSVDLLREGPLTIGIEARVRQPGLVAGPVGLLLGAKIRRFLAIESEGLRAAAEAAGNGESHP